MMKRKAIILLSGGLDSILAAKLLLEQGIELEALNFLTLFCTCTSGKESCLASQKGSKQLGIKLKVFEVSEEYLEIVKNPKHGYGSNFNPCIDCRIFMFKKAKEYMKVSNSSFIVTGEVLGERPMSQRRETINLIEKESGLNDLILRPLSAKLFKPTKPEKENWVDREKLLKISGRSRKPQISLAKDFGIKDYPCPAGGCLLTDPGFGRRIGDLIKHKPDFDLNDVKLLKLGRHFRLPPDLKLIVGRNEQENIKLQTLAREGDIIIDAQSLPGPLAVLRGETSEADVKKSASIAALYSKQKNEPKVKIETQILGKDYKTNIIEVTPADKDVRELLI